MFENKEGEEIKEKESDINIGDVYFDKGLDGVMEKEEFEIEVKNIHDEIEKYLGENNNQAVYDFRIYSNREEYESYMKTNFPEKQEEYYMENDMYCIYDKEKNKYHIGKFMMLDLNKDDPKVLDYLEKTGMTFEELTEKNRKEYKNNIYPTIAHEITHSHSFFKGVDYRETRDKWVQEMICVFIDQKMWEKYVPDYKKMTRDKASEQTHDKDLYSEIVQGLKVEGIERFIYEDWERFLYQFLEDKYNKDKLKDFWIAISEIESDFEDSFKEIFNEELKDIIMLFQQEISKEEN